MDVTAHSGHSISLEAAGAAPQLELVVRRPLRVKLRAVWALWVWRQPMQPGLCPAYAGRYSGTLASGSEDTRSDACLATTTCRRDIAAAPNGGDDDSRVLLGELDPRRGLVLPKEELAVFLAKGGAPVEPTARVWAFFLRLNQLRLLARRASALIARAIISIPGSPCLLRAWTYKTISHSQIFLAARCSSMDSPRNSASFQSLSPTEILRYTRQIDTPMGYNLSLCSAFDGWHHPGLHEVL